MSISNAYQPHTFNDEPTSDGALRFLKLKDRRLRFKGWGIVEIVHRAAAGAFRYSIQMAGDKPPYD